MIKKSFEISNLNFEHHNLYLFYGNNQGMKNELIELITERKKIKKFNYFEDDILKNIDEFINSLVSKSFFDNEKIIIIRKITDKFLNVIQDISDKNITDLTIILDSDELNKKSKIRIFFEKNKNYICVPFYPDNFQNLSSIALKIINENKKKISKEVLSLLVERSNGSRFHLRNELEKIINFSQNNKQINYIDIKKLTNLNDNYEISELVDNCLAKNQKKINRILSENNFSDDETVLIIRTFLIKAKRLLNLKKNIKEKEDIDNVINFFKPPIFWKDKPLIKQQMQNWSLENIQKLIYEINSTEYLIKKNFSNALNILLDFIYSKSKTTSN